ncbi:MAG TPA: T9SS type A sorting domain-containing protein [Ignavibacteria bacterium]|nr:T9SS type A sorting domain-containing protein [Ignavibacteria bacterium]
MKNIIILLLIFSCSEKAFSQLGFHWIDIQPGMINNVNANFSIAEDLSGNFYTTGFEYLSNYSDIKIIKFNSSGNILWMRSYNGSANLSDGGNSIAIDRANNVYISGYVTKTPVNTDIVLLKYNPDGDLIWDKEFSGSANLNDFGGSVVTDDSGNVFLSGNTSHTVSGSDITLIKYDSSGSFKWVKYYNSGLDTNDYDLKMKMDRNGNLCIAGYNNNSTGNNTKTLALKFDHDGDLLWNRIYNGPKSGFNTPHDFIVDRSDNMIITGCSPGIGSGVYDYITIKYDPDGEMKWLSRYNQQGTYYDVANSLAEGSDGSIYVTGVSGILINQSTFDIVTIKYDSNGTQKWSAIYNGAGNNTDIGNKILIDENENVFVTGITSGQGTLKDIVIIKYDSAGNQNDLLNFNSVNNLNENIYEGIISSNGELILAGNVQTGNTSYSALTMSISTKTNINVNSNLIPDEFKLYQNYPNPFNPKTIINYELQVTGEDLVNLKVFDVLGNEVAVLVNEKQNAGSYSVEFDGSNFSSGIYLYTLSTNGISNTMKMIMLK